MVSVKKGIRKMIEVLDYAKAFTSADQVITALRRNGYKSKRLKDGVVKWEKGKKQGYFVFLEHEKDVKKYKYFDNVKYITPQGKVILAPKKTTAQKVKKKLKKILQNLKERIIGGLMRLMNKRKM